SLSRSTANRLLCQALEPRVLMSQTWLVTDTGNATTNGNNLANILNGTTLQGGLPLQLGDTIVLTAGATYQKTVGYTLPSLTATGTFPTESSATHNGLGHLTAGVRVGPSLAQYMPKLTNGNGNSIIETTVSNGVPTHNFSLLGLEIAPNNGTQNYTEDF